MLGAADAVDLAGRRVPIVSVHDGEAGLLDNLGAIVGVPQVVKVVFGFSKCGTPAHVYGYHGLDSGSIAEACGEALATTALQQVRLHSEAVRRLERRPTADPRREWRELWPDPVKGEPRLVVIPAIRCRRRRP